MTQRERHASPGLSATAPADPPAPTCPAPVAELSRAGQDAATPPRASLWEEVFQSASPAQRQELLSLASRQGLLCPLRCLGQGRRLEDLPAAARSLTFPERVRALRENALAGAVRTREQAEQRCQRLRQEEAVWPRLQELAEEDLRLCAEVEAV